MLINKEISISAENVTSSSHSLELSAFNENLKMIKYSIENRLHNEELEKLLEGYRTDVETACDYILNLHREIKMCVTFIVHT